MQDTNWNYIVEKLNKHLDQVIKNDHYEPFDAKYPGDTTSSVQYYSKECITESKHEESTVYHKMRTLYFLKGEKGHCILQNVNAIGDKERLWKCSRLKKKLKGRDNLMHCVILVRIIY